MIRLVLPRNVKASVRHPCNKSDRCPTVSVVIPCYNYGRYLAECVKSVFEQQNVCVDVLIIDDASTDGSAELVTNLAAEDARIRTICHETNRGYIATFNEGLAQASGDYTVILSADDRLTPGCLARATSLMEEHASVGLTYGFPIDFTDTDLPPARTVATNWIIWRGYDWIAHRCKSGHNVLRSPEAIMRTSIIRGIGGFREDLPHTPDFEMWMRVATVSDVGYVSGADQAYYRVHENNMHYSFDTLADVSERLRAFDAIFTERSELLRNSNLLHDTAHRVLAREALGHAISAFARGLADQELVNDYAAFALTAWPDAKHFREWRTLWRLREMYEGAPRRNLWLITYEATRNLRYALRWRRWRMAGVY